jgi:phosphoribosylanthranilate isomerase
MTLVKICGNRTPEDVLAAADAGANFVGMVFAESKRQVTIAQAQAMVRALGAPLAEHEFSIPPPAQAHAREEIEPWFHHGADVIDSYLDVKRPLTVGVFADQPINEVNEIAEEVGLDLVQLSGDENWEDCLLVTKQVIQIVHVSALDSPSEALGHVQPGFAIALGLDSAHGAYRGGSGEVFDWEIARAIAGRIPIMLAGGLNPENVAQAIEVVEPWIVDVSSGTETDGVKDHDRINAFVASVVASDEQADWAHCGRQPPEEIP